jgi:hypothetical protein
MLSWVKAPNVYTEFAKDLRSQNIPGVEIEQSYSAGDILRYGLHGTIRTDVIFRDETLNFIAIWDLKTGTARLEPKRPERSGKKSVLGPRGRSISCFESYFCCFGRGASFCSD